MGQEQSDRPTIYRFGNGIHGDLTFKMDDTNNTLAAGYLLGF